MNFLENVWWLLVLIGVMILIHELGHFWAARLFDVKVEVFSFGFGPRLFGFRRKETDFRFSLILFGGYVKMAGEQAGEANASDPRSFLAKPRWQRLIIAAAGPFMNIVLAIALVTGLFMVRFPKMPVVRSPVIGIVTPDGAAAKAGIREGDRILRIEDVNNPTWEDITLKEIASGNKTITVLVEREDGRQELIRLTPTLDKTGAGVAGWAQQFPVKVSKVMPGMDAERVGLKPGDILKAINGAPIRSTLKLQETFRASNGAPARLTYVRDGKEFTVEVKPALTEQQGQKMWMIGVQLESPVSYVALPFPEALRESVHHNVRSAGLILDFLRGILERRLSPKQLEGPIRIAQISTEAAREGATRFIELMSMVSLNLAIFNLLPVPILDGGVILMLLIEMILRRDLSVAMKEFVFKLGFVFLMMVVAFVLYNDIAKIFPG
ncbi:MAG: RIP metalloprotease RseP [Bryobacteraceae bacterium]|nr:RIP metalloprotease RseP [Bryobacteraceae bacterium]MDW8379866.1 RIP metalloprotease RseP [Bryobacterales bacterium]